MSKESQREYVESCRQRYGKRGRRGKSVMVTEVCEALGWSRKHAIKALNGHFQQQSGPAAPRAGRRATYTAAEARVVVAIWRAGEQPCGRRLKAMLPEWIDSYERRHGVLESPVRERVLQASARTLERLTAPHRLQERGNRGRRQGRGSHRLKQQVAVRCGLWEASGPGWMEPRRLAGAEMDSRRLPAGRDERGARASQPDTVSHGGGATRGEFLHTLTLTDIHSGWTALRGLWGLSAGGVCQALDQIAADLPFVMQGFDCDNGSEFLNETLESWLAKRKVHWTRSRPYKKNDQAHVEQKNYTHVRLLLGYDRLGYWELKDLVNTLYREAWLPLRNHFTPVMKLVEKKRVEGQPGKWQKTYDEPATPYQRLLACGEVAQSTKEKLRALHARLDPFALHEAVEARLGAVFGALRRLEEGEELEVEAASAGEEEGDRAPWALGGCAPSPVAPAPGASAPPPSAQASPAKAQAALASVS